MSHTLAFLTRYKSIKSLPTIELPKFSVLTGRNGSGKTHLLEALKEGHVKSSIVDKIDSDILMLDWNSIIPKDTGVFDPSLGHTRRSQWFVQIDKQREKNLSILQQQATKLGIPPHLCSSISQIRTLTVDRLRDVFPSVVEAEHALGVFKRFVREAGSRIHRETSRKLQEAHYKVAAENVARNSPEMYMTATETCFFQHEEFVWGEVDPFQQTFGRLFTSYRELVHANDRLEKHPAPNEPELRHLSNDQFIEEYGPSPWDFVNQVLAVCELDFRVSSPPMHAVTPFEPKLIKISDKTELRFQDLSSGEKVLMSFALCLYNSQDSRQRKRFPRLLLLDEVDAPLHPSMTRSLLNTIQKVLVEDKGVVVILTTHSPSTVALAPEGCVYTIFPEGPKIEQVTRGSALNILTEGVPTLAISYEGRRLVFVESDSDAGLYDGLYQCYKDELGSERSLTFLGVGRYDAGIELNGGREQVRALVNKLGEAGIQNVFGLIDWDCENQSSSRIHVLSENIRDSIESLLLDPVLVVALLAQNPSYAEGKGVLTASEGFLSLQAWESARWQKAVDKVQEIIFPNCQSEQIQVEYLSGMKLNISKHYLHTDGHDLAKAVTSAFEILRPKNQTPHKLIKYVVDSILREYHDLVPIELLRTFGNLLSEPTM